MSEYITSLHKGQQLFANQQWLKAKHEFQMSLCVIRELIETDIMEDTHESLLWLHRYICCSYLKVIDGIQNIDKVIKGCMDHDLTIQHNHLELLHRCLQKPASPIKMLIDHSCNIVAQLIKIVNDQRSQSQQPKNQKITNNYIAWQCLVIIGRTKYGFSKLYHAGVTYSIVKELTNFIKHETDDWTYCQLTALSIIANAAKYQQHRNDLLNDKMNIMEIILQYQTTLFNKYETHIIQTFSMKIFHSVTMAIIRLSQDRPWRWNKIDLTSIFVSVHEFVSQSPQFNCIPYLYKLMTGITSNLTTKYDDNIIFNLMCDNDMYRLLWEHECGLKTFPDYVSLFSNIINEIYWQSDKNNKITKINKIIKYNFSFNVLNVLKHTNLQLYDSVYFNDNVPHLKHDTWKQCFVIIYNIITHCNVNHFVNNIIESHVFTNVLLFNNKLLSHTCANSAVDKCDMNKLTMESFMTQPESLLLIEGYLKLNIDKSGTKLFVIKDICRIIANYYYDYSHLDQLSMIDIIIHVISIATTKIKKINVVHKHNIIQHLTNVLVKVKNIYLQRLIMDVIRDCINITDDINHNDNVYSMLKNWIQNLVCHLFVIQNTRL